MDGQSIERFAPGAETYLRELRGGPEERQIPPAACRAGGHPQTGRANPSAENPHGEGPHCLALAAGLRQAGSDYYHLVCTGFGEPHAPFPDAKPAVSQRR